jgi:hypothetical protein
MLYRSCAVSLWRPPDLDLAAELVKWGIVGYSFGNRMPELWPHPTAYQFRGM